MLTGYAENVGKGINLDLSGLNESDKNELIKFIARVSEVSYRRGFQQAYVMHDRIELDPHKLRYEMNIDDAPFAEDGTPSGLSAVDVLMCEYKDSFFAISLI